MLFDRFLQKDERTSGPRDKVSYRRLSESHRQLDRYLLHELLLGDEGPAKNRKHNPRSIFETTYRIGRASQNIDYDNGIQE